MTGLARHHLTSLGLGLLMIILTMGTIVGLAISQMQAMRYELNALVHVNNKKIDLVQTLRHIVRERMISINQIVVDDDPFKRDEIAVYFHTLANRFIATRQELEKLVVTPQEKEYLKALGAFTARASAFHEEVVELAEHDKISQARERLLQQSIPAQSEVMRQMDKTLDYYRGVAKEIEAKATDAYNQAISRMIALGLFGVALSIGIAMWVIGRAATDRKALAGEVERRIEAETALQQVNNSLETQVAERTKELGESIALLAQAQRVGHIGHWVRHLDDDRVYWSDQIYHILGYPPHAFEAQHEILDASIHPDDRAEVRAVIEQAISSRQCFRMDHRIQRPDGAVRNVRHQGEIDFDATGRATRILATIQDITENKVAEKELRLAASVFHNAAEGILITDENNFIVNVNEAFSDITGYQPEEVLGQSPSILKSGKHSPAFYQQMWADLLETGTWQGEIWDKRKNGDVYPKWQCINTVRDETGNVTNYVAIFRDISEIKQREEQLWTLAHFDPLCNVANRSLMYANLRQAMLRSNREKNLVAIVMIDLDYFKEVNDTFGHGVGDQLLIHVAQQLQSALRESDTVARLGGDEFAIILEQIRDKEDAARIAEKIWHALQEPFNMGAGRVLPVSASMGITLYPLDADDIEGLMKNADRAMYRAKEIGKNNHQFFQAS